jgi:DNA modification methylase
VKIRKCLDPKCARPFPQHGKQRYCSKACCTNHAKRRNRCRVAPLWESPAAVLYHGDSRKALRQIGAGTVDLIVTSPPFPGLRDYGAADQIGREGSVEESLVVLLEVFEECRRVLKDTGLMFFHFADAYDNGDQMNLPWQLAEELKKHGWIQRNTYAWAKTNAPPPNNSLNRAPSMWEPVFKMAKAPRGYRYHQIKIRTKHAGKPHKAASPYRHKSNRVFNNKRDRAGERVADLKPEPNFWYGPPVSGKSIHPARMPLWMAEKCCLVAGVGPGCLVLDPFCGTATTGEAAIGKGAEFVGIDTTLEYLVLEAVPRLEAVRYQPVLPLPWSGSEEREEGVA